MPFDNLNSNRAGGVLALAFLVALSASFTAIPSSAHAAALQSGDIIVPEFFEDGLLKVDPLTGGSGLISSIVADFSGLVAVDRNKQVIVLDSNEHLLRFNPATGSSTQLSDTVFTFAEGLAIEPSGKILVATDSDVYRIDPSNGATSILSTGTFFAPSGIAVTPSGDIYITEFFNQLEKIDAVTGVATPLPGVSSVDNFTEGMTSDAAGNLILVNHENLLRINPLTSAITTIATNVANFPQGVAVEPNGKILVASTQGLLQFDPITGAKSTLAGGTFFYPEGVAVVPEPSTLILAACGAIALCTFGRRRFVEGRR